MAAGMGMMTMPLALIAMSRGATKTLAWPPACSTSASK
jgi:hypothetical protein